MAAEVSVPMLGESVLEATVGHWLKREGESVAVGDVMVELETDKVNAEIAADEAGVLERILHQEGETVHPGDVLAVIGTDGRLAAAAERQPTAEAKPAEPVPTETATPAAQPAEEHPLRVSSVAQRLAAELGVDLGKVAGSGPGGRVTREDVEAFARQQQAVAAAPPPAVATPAPPLAPAISAGDRGETRQRLSRRRLTIARRLVEAQHAAAMLTTFNEVDMSAIMATRRRQRDAFQKRHGVSLGYMSFFTKAAVGALKAFPQVNAELQGDELVLKHYYDIGIAIGDPEGLVVPVIRDADRLTFAEIEQAIAGFVNKLREKTLSVEDLRGGTFTITNGGIYGSLNSTPILNPPQVAILGMHVIQQRPVVENDQIVIRPMMYLALSYDHRVVDGREAVQFLVRVKELVEQPELLLIDG